MRYLTDRKRAVGMGSAKTGTAHHWKMMVTAVGLALLVPFFVFTFGYALGMEHDAAVAYYQRPFPAIVAILTMLVGFFHFNSGFRVLIEDYVHGMARTVAIVAMTCLSYAAAALGVYAIVRVAL